MELETPCLVVDSAVLARNIEQMAQTARAAGVALRPHVKTHKTPELARMQIAAGARGVTVAKVSEAEVMAAGGIDDIFIAYPLVTSTKIERALRLTERCRIVFAVDCFEGAQLLSKAAAMRGTRVPVRLEIDTGMHRTGVPVASALETAKAIDGLAGIELTGIFTFRGSLLNEAPTLDRRAAGVDEGRIMVSLAEELRNAGLSIRDVSVGSTPTAEFAATIGGVTEIRPGTYIFNDRMQAAFGVCSIADCALSVLVTVVSVAGSNHIVVDGGSKCFATDAVPGTAPLHLRGYGEVMGSRELVLARLSEEHGVIEPAGGRRFRIGEQLRIIPNHVCTTVNLHDSLWMIGAPDAEPRELVIAARGMTK